VLQCKNCRSTLRQSDNPPLPKFSRRVQEFQRLMSRIKTSCFCCYSQAKDDHAVKRARNRYSADDDHGGELCNTGLMNLRRAGLPDVFYAGGNFPLSLRKGNAS
jgi:hypothetical protein